MSNQNTIVALSDLERMASSIAKSGLFGIKTPEQAVALMLVAQAEGRHPGSVAREYHIISGRPALRSDAMLARFQQSGGSVQWGERTDKTVSGTFSHPQGGNLTLTWTIEDAKRAGIYANQWTKYPRQMLTARVISEGVRAVFPSVVAGVYTPEEVSDFEPQRGSQPSTPSPSLAVRSQEKVTEVEVEVSTKRVEDIPALPSPVKPESEFCEKANVSKDVVFALMDRDGINEKTILGFLESLGRNKKGVEYVADLSNSTLENLARGWEKVQAFAKEAA